VKYCLLVVASIFTFFSYAQTDTSFKAYTQLIPGTNVQFKMVPIPSGSFLMGSADTDKDAEKDEMPQRNFSVSAFWMGAYEVNHDEFNLFFQDQDFAENSKVDAVTRPTPQYIDLSWGMGTEGGYPANSMQQFTALMYCHWLYKKTGIFYRLPTEAEWEYACRAGTNSIYFFGNNSTELPKYAWYKNNGKSVYHKVGLLQPNAWGLYDILGNVAEWTLDQYDEGYFTKLAAGSVDPVLSPVTTHPRTVRGGSFEDEAKDLRIANRTSWEPSWNQRDPQIPKSRWWLTDAAFVGFRVVRPLKQPSAGEAEAFFKLHLRQ
jgi:formylglycine-generating enzyme required for sulfatase activity